MNRLPFLLLLSLSAIQCGGAAEFNLRSAPAAATSPVDAVSQQWRSLSSSEYSIGWYWILLNHLGLHLGDCGPKSEKAQHCPHPPHPSHKKSSSSSSGSSGSSSGSSSSSSSSSSGGSSSSSNSSGGSSNGADCSSAADCEDTQNCCKEGSTSASGEKWGSDGWESSNLDNGANTNGAGASVGVSAKSIVPFVVGALVAAAIGVALVVALKRRRQQQDGHPLEGSLKKRMRLFSGGFKKQGALNDEVTPEFVEIASVGTRGVKNGATSRAGTYNAPRPAVSGFNNDSSDDSV